MFSRKCYYAVGGWDESFFLYSEETEFCLGARDLGFRTRYEPSAVAIHLGGESGRSATTHTMQVVNRVRCYRRRHGVIRSSIFMMLVLLREVTWGIRDGERSWTAIRAMLRPSLRPAELRCSDRLLPR
jgi:GT2 family glycosyltransferase